MQDTAQAANPTAQEETEGAGDARSDPSRETETLSTPPPSGDGSDDAATDALADLLESRLVVSKKSSHKPPPSTPGLRPYQTELLDKVRNALFSEGKQRVLMYLPTGGGKTAICAQVIQAALSASQGLQRVGMFVHTDDIFYQTQGALVTWGVDERDIGLVKARELAHPDRRVQVCMIQTFSSLKRREGGEGEKNKPFDMLVIDEAHHAASSQYKALLAQFPEALVLGVTATPCRLDAREDLGKMFDCRIDGPSMAQLMHDGFLVRPAVVGSFESKQGTVGPGRARDGEVIEKVARNWQARCASRKTIVFAIDLQHAKQIRDVFRNVTAVNAQVIDGTMDRDTRRDLYAKSKSGEIPVLCSVDVCSEGVDTVWIDCLVLLCPIRQSLARFVQQVGRGLRPFPGKPANCVVFDEVGNFFRHGFVDDVDWERQRGKHKPVKCKGFTTCRCLVGTNNKTRQCGLCWGNSSTKSGLPLIPIRGAKENVQ